VDGGSLPTARTARGGTAARAAARACAAMARGRARPRVSAARFSACSARHLAMAASSHRSHSAPQHLRALACSPVHAPPRTPSSRTSRSRLGPVAATGLCGRAQPQGVQPVPPLRREGEPQTARRNATQRNANATRRDATRRDATRRRLQCTGRLWVAERTAQRRRAARAEPIAHTQQTQQTQADPATSSSEQQRQQQPPPPPPQVRIRAPPTAPR
jgi:hypothetical protein